MHIKSDQVSACRVADSETRLPINKAVNEDSQAAAMRFAGNESDKIHELQFRETLRKSELLSKIGVRRCGVGGASGASSAQAVAERAAAAKELGYDGKFVGADGKVYDANTPLDRIPAVMPPGGKATMHRVIYVNGITTPKETQFENMAVIAGTIGAPVVGIHNSTEGQAKDIAQCARDKNDVGKNPAHDTLTRTIVGELRQGRSVHILAHSQGGLITSRSLRWAETILYKQEIAKRGSMINPLIKTVAREEVARLMGKIQVETFGAASTGYPYGPRYVHYINRSDMVPMMMGLGADPDKSVAGGDRAVIREFRANFPGSKIADVIPNSKPIDLIAAPHAIDTCYMSYRIDFAQAHREGDKFMDAPVRPFGRPGFEIQSDRGIW